MLARDPLRREADDRRRCLDQCVREDLTHPTCSAPATRQGYPASTSWSGEEFLHDATGYVGEAEVAALEAIGQLGVVEAQEVEEGRVQVVDVDLVLDRLEAEVVAGTQGDAGLDAAAGEP